MEAVTEPVVANEQPVDQDVCLDGPLSKNISSQDVCSQVKKTRSIDHTGGLFTNI